jgi:hypothetical protein
MLFGAKTIADFLEIRIRRIPMLISSGAPIRRIGTRNGVRYMANRKALFDWVCCRDSKRKAAKAG